MHIGVRYEADLGQPLDQKLLADATHHVAQIGRIGVYANHLDLAEIIEIAGAVGIQHQAPNTGCQLGRNMPILVGTKPPACRIRHGIVGGGVAHLVVAATAQIMVAVAAADGDINCQGFADS